MNEDLSNLANLESELEKLEIKDEFSNNLEDYFIKLIEVNKELNSLRNEIRKDKLKELTDEKKDHFRERLRDAYKKQDDLIEHTEEPSLSLEEKEKFYKNQNYIKVLSIKLDNQILIGRIVNKIQREEARRIDIKNEKLKDKTETFKLNIEKTYEEIKKENSQSKESILTISSLVFTAFTLIQLNFSAFQNSKDYSVLDRVILFAGINLFLLLGVYCILSMIKSFIDINTSKDKEGELFGKIIIITFLIAAIFTFSLYQKSRTEDIYKKNNMIIEKVENENIKLIEEINYYKNELNKTNQKINNLEILMTNYRKEYFLLENNFLNLKQNYEEINNKNVTK